MTPEATLVGVDPTQPDSSLNDNSSPRQQPVNPMPRDNFKHGYPLLYSEDAYPPQLDPAMSRTQAFAVLAAISTDNFRQQRQHMQRALFFQQREEHLLAAIDRLIQTQGGPVLGERR